MTSKVYKLPKKKILIIDDEYLISHLIKNLLETEYEVITASDGENGLIKAIDEKPDLILLDVVMPKMDGFSFLEKLRKITETPVILLTARSKDEDKILGFKLGADEYITKPFSVSELEARIRAVLRRRSNKRNGYEYKNLEKAYKSNIELLTNRIKVLESNNKPDTNGIYETGYLKSLNDIKLFIGGTVHTLKGEMSIIGTYIDFVSNDRGNIVDFNNDLDVMKRSIQYCQLLIQRMMNTIDLGKTSRNPEKVVDIIDKINLLVPSRIKTNIKFILVSKVNFTTSIVNIDLQQLIGVILESVKNSEAAIGNNSGSISIEMDQKEDLLFIRVIDDGPGIPTKILDKLFKERIASQEGYGLGLFLSKVIINSMGGDLLIEGSEPKRTSILITLPIVRKNYDISN